MKMCGLLTGLLRPRLASLPRARVMVQQKATYVHSKPPKNKVGALESMFVLTVMTLTVMVPSGWVLANLEDYKTRK
ncbi:cytochrome c oxidase subunit 8A, mitochondrial-like [Limanda limanda]|uniref:cytochrome c oxidase subunit 8A, mitochondrial-like n=1 Tax=Limanda limanda TaxID=27771 RepID=UPI0029C9090A|nr:cytochrome c oxidase subunit 8A, mitochondrial-like [Limanda limanda]